MSPALIFLLSLLIDGALAGAIYALIALLFVLVYKSSRIVNFALGEWIMAGALLAAAGQHALGLGLPARSSPPPPAWRRSASRSMRCWRNACWPAGHLADHGDDRSRRADARRHGADLRRLPSCAGTAAADGATDPPRRPDRIGEIDRRGCAALIIALATWFYRRSRAGSGCARSPTTRRRPRRRDRSAAPLRASVGHHRGHLGGRRGFVGFRRRRRLRRRAGRPQDLSDRHHRRLDSLPGTIVAAMLIGILESLGAGYLDPLLAAALAISPHTC